MRVAINAISVHHIQALLAGPALLCQLIRPVGNLRRSFRSWNAAEYGFARVKMGRTGFPIGALAPGHLSRILSQGSSPPARSSSSIRRSSPFFALTTRHGETTADGAYNDLGLSYLSALARTSRGHRRKVSARCLLLLGATGQSPENKGVMLIWESSLTAAGDGPDISTERRRDQEQHDAVSR